MYAPNDGFAFVPDLNLNHARAVRDQMYYDLVNTNPKTMFYGNPEIRYYSPEYIQLLKNQALQLNDIYKDLLKRQTLINYLNG